MRFYFTEPKKFERIEKAVKPPKNRIPWKKTRTMPRLEALSKQMAGSVKVDLVRGITKFRKDIPNPEEIYQAWLSGGYAGIVSEIKWDKLYTDLIPETHKSLEAAHNLGAGFAFNKLEKPVQESLRYDYKNPRIERVWKERAGEWIVDPLINGSRAAIQDVVHRQFTQALNPRDMAKEIRNHIGLYPRLANAHSKYVDGLEATGMDPDRVDVLADRYYNKLLDYRALMIARTETQFQVNRGQQEVWRQSVENGLIPQKAEKEWITRPGCCDICKAMNGKRVLLVESWVLPNGNVCETPTEAHPHCYCLMKIVY